jgi:hypothetical protein
MTFVIVKASVLFAVRPEFLNMIYTKFCFEGLIIVYNSQFWRNEVRTIILTINFP